jgi:hypothetical protein
VKGGRRWFFDALAYYGIIYISESRRSNQNHVEQDHELDGLPTAQSFIDKVSVENVRALQGEWVLDVGKSGLADAYVERRVVTLGPTWL